VKNPAETNLDIVLQFKNWMSFASSIVNGAGDKTWKNAIFGILEAR